MKNDKSKQVNEDKTVVILSFEGEDARRFRAYMEREHIDNKAPAAKKLILDRLDELERAA